MGWGGGGGDGVEVNSNQLFLSPAAATVAEACQR